MRREYFEIRGAFGGKPGTFRIQIDINPYLDGPLAWESAARFTSDDKRMKEIWLCDADLSAAIGAGKLIEYKGKIWMKLKP